MHIENNPHNVYIFGTAKARPFQRHFKHVHRMFVDGSQRLNWDLLFSGIEYVMDSFDDILLRQDCRLQCDYVLQKETLQNF